MSGAITIIGAGGTGYHLAEPLVRFVNYTTKLNAPDIFVIDGDRVEEKNYERQHGAGSSGQMKAEVMVAALSEKINYRGRLSAITSYVTPQTQNSNLIKQALGNNSTVFVCVDNNPSRVFVEDLLNQHADFTLISGGNDLSSGQVNIHVKRKGVVLTPSPSEINPEILNDDEAFPDEVACTEAVISDPQLLFANLSVATAMLNIWYSSVLQYELSGRPIPADIINEVILNVLTASAHQFKRTSNKKRVSTHV